MEPRPKGREMSGEQQTPYEIKRMPVEIRPEGSIAPMSNPMFKGDPPYTGAWADAAYDPESPGWIHHPGERTIRGVSNASAARPPLASTHPLTVPSYLVVSPRSDLRPLDHRRGYTHVH